MSKKRNDEKHSQEQFYLETSIQIKRVLGHPKHKALIEKTLQDSKKFSSYFIYREFKAALIVPLIDFYFILREEDTLRDAIKVYSDMCFSTRDLKEIMLFLSELDTKNDYSDKNKALSYVFNYIYQIYILFEDLIDGYVANISGFINNKVNLEFTSEGYRKFSDQLRCSGKCGQERFWTSQSQILELLLKPEIDDKYYKHKDFKKHLEIFAEIKNDISRADMPTRCLKLGDPIIAIECPKTFTLLSLDSIFEIYGTVLEKKYLILPSLQKLRSISYAS